MNLLNNIPTSVLRDSDVCSPAVHALAHPSAWGEKKNKETKIGYQSYQRYLLNILCSHAARHCCPRSAWFDGNAAWEVKFHWPLSGDPRHKCAELPSWNWKCCPCFGWASAGCPGVAGVATSGKWWHPRPASRGSTSPARSVPPVDTSTYTLAWFDSLKITKQMATATNIVTGTKFTITRITKHTKCWF